MPEYYRSHAQYKAADEDTPIPEHISMYKQVQLTGCLPVWSKKLKSTFLFRPGMERREKQKACLGEEPRNPTPELKVRKIGGVTRLKVCVTPFCLRSSPRPDASDQHPRGTASAAFHPCRQKDYPVTYPFLLPRRGSLRCRL